MPSSGEISSNHAPTCSSIAENSSCTPLSKADIIEIPIIDAMPIEMGGANPHCAETVSFEDGSIFTFSTPPTGGQSQSHMAAENTIISSEKVPCPGMLSESWTLNASKLISKSSAGIPSIDSISE